MRTAQLFNLADLLAARVHGLVDALVFFDLRGVEIISSIEGEYAFERNGRLLRIK